ncbi:hypothetical protein [Cupriavidus campinensis]|uniref:Nucleotide-diphospho-sugar transferase domain-containing protein n=1 Tax=Cupriavidus campinensis TaxID=151783 RepID=A0AAE9I0P0_9BURK|nr:hypothetical protein [Cupriavidus campinensis]URF03415.1 hypothetical protein M5D45_12870 [Cupriavidus campinensis]
MSAKTSPFFLTFHVDTSAPVGQGVHPNANLAHQQYLRMIDLLFHSVRLFHAAAECAILTTSETDLAPLRVPCMRVDGAIDPTKLMLGRTLSQNSFIKGYNFARPLVLIDSDILLNRPLTDVFERDFDVAVTWRKSHNMPINGGLMILNNRRPEVVRIFFQRFVDIYLEKYAGDEAKWYGDQLAIRDCVGLSHHQMRQREIREIDGCKILFLPCEVFNFSPENRASSIRQRDQTVSVLHFKGERKRLMEPYWLMHLLPLKSRSLMSRYRSWRATRHLPMLAACDPQPEQGQNHA